MGTAFTNLIKAINCETCNKYFLNELECKSDCCEGKLCNIHLETHETAKDTDSDDEVTLDVGNLIHYKKG